MFIYTFQSLTFVLISTWEIFTICWIAFGVVTSEWQERDGGVVSCQNSDHCWYPAPESLSGHQVTSDHRGVWVTSDTISRHRGREEEWRQWYDRNMETRLTRGHSQDSGMSLAFYKQKIPDILRVDFVISINLLLCTLRDLWLESLPCTRIILLKRSV